MRVKVEFKSKHTGEWLPESWIDLDKWTQEKIDQAAAYYKSLGLEWRYNTVDKW